MKQEKLEALESCPLCSSKEFSEFLISEDQLVSRETFRICQCVCGFLFTSPRPKEEFAGEYYESDQYISHSDTSKGLINKLYLLARIFSVRMKVSFAEKTHPGARKLLDFGCGTGWFLNAARKAGFVVEGIEPDEPARKISELKYGITPKVPEELDKLEKGSFDIITLWHVLEHIHELNKTVEILKSLLRPGGKLILAVPNVRSYDCRHFGSLWAAWDVPRHLYHFTPKTMTSLAEKHELHVIKIKTMPLDGFYVSMLSEKYKRKPFWLLRAIVIGIIGLFKSIIKKQEASSLIYVVG